MGPLQALGKELCKPALMVNHCTTFGIRSQAGEELNPTSCRGSHSQSLKFRESVPSKRSRPNRPRVDTGSDPFSLKGLNAGQFDKSLIRELGLPLFHKASLIFLGFTLGFLESTAPSQPNMRGIRMDIFRIFKNFGLGSLGACKLAELYILSERKPKAESRPVTAPSATFYAWSGPPNSSPLRPFWDLGVFEESRISYGPTSV